MINTTNFSVQGRSSNISWKPTKAGAI